MITLKSWELNDESIILSKIKYKNIYYIFVVIGGVLAVFQKLFDKQKALINYNGLLENIKQTDLNKGNP